MTIVEASVATFLPMRYFWAKLSHHHKCNHNSANSIFDKFGLCLLLRRPRSQGVHLLDSNLFSAISSYF